MIKLLNSNLKYDKMLKIVKGNGKITYYYSPLVIRVIFGILGLGLLGTGLYLLGGELHQFSYFMLIIGVVFVILDSIGLYGDFHPLTLDLMKKRLIKGKKEIQVSNIQSLCLSENIGQKGGRLYQIIAILKDGTSKSLSEEDSDYTNKKSLLETLSKDTMIPIKTDAQNEAREKVIQYITNLKGSGLAIASLILSFFSIVPLIGIFFSTIALIIGAIGYKKDKSTLSKVTLWIAIIALVLNILFVVGIGALFYSNFSNANVTVS